MNSNAPYSSLAWRSHRSRLAAVILTGCLSAGGAHAGSLFNLFGYDGNLAPGAPWSTSKMARVLTEEGFVLRADLVQTGPVYIANVEKFGRPLCLVLDAFNGTLLQAFAASPRGLRAINRDAPGPGFPGYPPFSDARFAPACAPTLAAAAPLTVRKPHKVIPRRKLRRLRKRQPPKCRPEPGDKRPPVPPFSSRERPSTPPARSAAAAGGRFCPRPARG